jgi:hypothetical protein
MARSRIVSTARRRASSACSPRLAHSSSASLHASQAERARPRMVAYLAAFATYGYRYLLQPAFGPLREAIADPSAVFDPVTFVWPDRGALDPLIVEVAAPASLAGCRAVAFGPRLIVLPPWGASVNWFATLRNPMTNETAANHALASVIGRRSPTVRCTSPTLSAPVDGTDR